MAYTRSSKTYYDTRLFLFGESRPTSGVYSGVPSFQLDSSRTGDSCRGYKQRIKDQLDATTEMSATSETISLTRGWFTLRHKKGYTGYNIPYTGDCLVPTPSLATYVDNGKLNASKAQAIARFNKNIIEYQRPFQAQIFLGELRQTIQYLRNPFATSLKLANTLDSLMSKALRSRQSAKDVAAIWLEFRFGVLPLLSDIRTILDVVERQATEADIIRVKGYGVSETTTVENTYVGFTTSMTPRSLTTTNLRAETFIKAGLLVRKLDQSRKAVDRAIESVTSLAALPETMWELTPYSFLVDYFVNVGDLLSAPVAAYSSLNYYSLSTVTTAERKCKFVDYVVNYPHIFQSIDISKPTSWITKRRAVQRTGVQQAIPPLTFTVPGRGVQWINIAALLARWKL